MNSSERYRPLINSLEMLAKVNPKLYKTKLALLALLGYGYIGLILFLSFGLSFGILLFMAFINTGQFILIKVAWIPLTFAFVLIKAMWFRISPPEGVELTLSQAPVLFEEIEAMRNEMKTKKIYKVLVTADYNAGVVQIPVIWFLGWYRQYLMLGLPLMMSLTKDEFRAVLAHELAHLSKNHGRFSNLIYRIRKTWDQLLIKLISRQSAALKIFTAFFNWYAPYFDAYSYVLARGNEYSADRLAGEITDKEVSAKALVRVAIKGAEADSRFFPEIYKLADIMPAPPADLFAQFGGFARQINYEFSENVLADALKKETDISDTHPCLNDRLNALGVKPAVPEGIEVSAAEVFLGGAFQGIVDDESRKWELHISGAWRERNAFIDGARSKISELGKGMDRSAAQGQVLP